MSCRGKGGLPRLLGYTVNEVSRGDISSYTMELEYRKIPWPVIPKGLGFGDLWVRMYLLDMFLSLERDWRVRHYIVWNNTI